MKRAPYDDSPAIRGKGYDVEALNMIFEYGFGVPGLDEIRVWIMEPMPLVVRDHEA